MKLSSSRTAVFILLDCSLLLLQEWSRQRLQSGILSKSRNQRRKNLDVGPPKGGHVFVKCIPNVRKILRNMMLTIERRSFIQHAIEAKNSEDVEEPLRPQHSVCVTLSLILIVWTIAITAGTTAMVLDMTYGSQNLHHMAYTSPLKLPYCTNAYLENLAGRYAIMIITV